MKQLKKQLESYKKHFKEAVDGVKDFFHRKKIAKENARKRLIKTLTIFIVVVIVLLIISSPIFAYEYIYQDKIYSGVYVDGLNLGGLTEDEAINKINRHIDNLKENGLNFNYQNQRFNVGFIALSPDDPDLVFPILSFEAEKMVKQAYTYGRDSHLLANLLNQLRSILEQKEVKLNFALNESELVNILEQRYSKFEQPAVNARINFTTNTEFKILPEKAGQIIDYNQAVSDLVDELNLVSIDSVILKTRQSLPAVTRQEATQARALVPPVLKKEKIILTYDDKEWEIVNSEFKNWLVFDKEEKNTILTFDQELLAEKLTAIAEEINLVPKDARLTLEDGKVTEFEAHKNGQELDLEANDIKINQGFLKDNKETIELVVNEKEPNIKTADINDFGIEEIIGVGVSDFSGSSNNRIKNIANAVEHLHGMLIKPGEEFSMVAAIGDVDAASGYYPEYVIKGDRTIKEYGGGLCQIATTMFRAALYTGLSITERKPHSYVVSYYNPIGMDATIYGPHPDLRFMNDTGSYILIQSYMEGTEVSFTFWGTNDGRIIEITDPENYNWRSPGPAKLIENPNLKPGEKKIIEYAKRGADAHFYRYITRPGQEKEEEIWRSHYTAWPAIYEIGVEPAAEGENDPDEGVLEPPPEGEEPSI